MAAGGRTDDGSVRERPPGRCLSERGGGSEREGGKVSVRSKNEMTCKIPTRGRDRGSQSIRREVHAPPILLIAVTMRDREVLSL